MTIKDITIVCKDCGRNFIFRSDEQNFYAEKGYDEPTRCKDCRATRKSNMNQSNSRPFREGGSTGRFSKEGAFSGRPADKQMFPVICASCGKQTQIPFLPREGRPVYCSDCFSKNR